MFSQKKPLLRSNSHSEWSGMRNWPLFAFLFGLVFFFYIIYVYQAQSNEVAVLKEQLDAQGLTARNLKKEMIDAKAEVEQLKSSSDALKKDNSDLTTKYDECQSSLRSSKLKAESVGFEKTKFEETMKEKDVLIEELRKNVSEAAGLRNLLAAQETITSQLNETIKILQSEIETLKSAAPKQSVPEMPQVPQSDAQKDGQLPGIAGQVTPAKSPEGINAQAQQDLPKAATAAKDHGTTTTSKNLLVEDKEAKVVDEPVPHPDQLKDDAVPPAESEKEDVVAAPKVVKGGDYDDGDADGDRRVVADDQDQGQEQDPDADQRRR